MSDNLLVPDRSIVSIEEAREEAAAQRNGRPLGKAHDTVTVKTMCAFLDENFVSKTDIVQIVAKVNKGISDAALAVGQKVYDQVVDETQEHLEMMHFKIRQQVLADIEARSLLGRIRRAWAIRRDCLREYLTDLGVIAASAPAVRLMGEPMNREEVVEAYAAMGMEPTPAQGVVTNISEVPADVTEPCLHVEVNLGNPARCKRCGVAVSIAAGPRVDAPL